jgi:DMSO/TMAO reductase YedYZ molybdopterin-dependent catalytic subunit
MNLKFFEDIFQTIELMKSGFYYLGLLIGVHTVTFAAYLAYKYLNDENNSKKKELTEKEQFTEKEPELPPPLTTTEPVIQMEEVTDLLEKKDMYKSLLEQKREELGTLIAQLDSVYDNIGQIRERLETLNTKNN